MIDAGLPEDRAGWPEGVLEALQPFRQGDVVAAPPLLYYADPSSPVWAATAEAALSEPDVVVVDGVCQLAMITSQTCDIGEEDAELPARPFVQVAPVYDITEIFDGGTRRLLSRGRGYLYLLHLPALENGFWVADLRLEMPVEKGWLSKQTRIAGFHDERTQQVVGERLARLRNRPAFGGEFVEAVHRPLVDALKALRANNRDLWQRVLEHVDQVRVALDSRLHPTSGQMYVLDPEPIPADVEAWFRSWWDEVNPVAQATGIALQGIRFLAYSNLSAGEYLASDELDLTRVSPM